MVGVRVVVDANSPLLKPSPDGFTGAAQINAMRDDDLAMLIDDLGLARASMAAAGEQRTARFKHMVALLHMCRHEHAQRSRRAYEPVGLKSGDAADT